MLHPREVGDKIKLARELYSSKIGKKYTQTMLATDLGISRSYLADMERGRTYPSYELLSKMTTLMSVPSSFFMAPEPPQEKFEPKKLKELRGDRSYQEYSDFLGGFSPLLLERYENGIEVPHKSILDYIANFEGIECNYFFNTNINNQQIMSVRDYFSFIDDEIFEWLMKQENKGYIEFAYKAYKKGLTPEALNNADIHIPIK